MIVVKLLRKKEVLFIGNRLLQIDLTVMEAFVTKELDTTEYHVSCYPTRKTLWLPTSLNRRICAFICTSTVFILFVLGLSASLVQDLFLPLASITKDNRLSIIVVEALLTCLTYVTKPLAAVC